MQSDDSIWRGHRKREFGKDLAVSLAKFAIQRFPEIGRVEGTHGIALVISHEEVKRISVLDLLFKHEVDVLQRSWSPVNIVPQKNQLILRLEIPVDNFLRGFKVTMGIANENNPARFELYQLCF